MPEAPTILFKSTDIEYNSRSLNGKIVPLYEGDRVPFRVEVFDDQGEEVRAFVNFQDGTVEKSDWLSSHSEVTFYHSWKHLGIYPVEIWTQDKSGHESLHRRVETVITRHPGIADRPHVGMSNLNGLQGGFDEGYGREFMSRMADEGLNVIREHFVFHDWVVDNLEWTLEQIQKMFEFGNRNRIVIISSLFMFTRGHEEKGIRDHEHCGERSGPAVQWVQRVSRLANPYGHIIIDTGNEPTGTCEDRAYHRWIRDTAADAGAKRFSTQLPPAGHEFEFFNTHVHIDRPEDLRSRPTGGKRDWRLFVESDTERYSRTTPDLAVRWLDHVLDRGHSGIILSPGDTRIDDNVKNIIRSVGSFGRKNDLI